MGRAWDRRDDETHKSYHAFTLYLRLGPNRTLDEVRKALDRPDHYLRQVKEWSRTHDWVARAAAYDEWLEQALYERDRERAVELAERHGNIAQRALRLVEVELELYEQASEANSQRLAAKLEAEEPLDADDLAALGPSLTPSELARLLDVAVKVERLAAGAYTEYVRTEAAVEDLSDEELRALLVEELDAADLEA